MGKEVTGTRNRIVQLLRKHTYTVENLAKVLGVTENAIRAQIALLLREGLVEPATYRKVKCWRPLGPPLLSNSAGF